MAATIERTQEYETHNRQFCSRLIEYLLIMFKFQVYPLSFNERWKTDHLLQSSQCEIALGLAANAIKNATSEIPRHAQLEDKLGKYCGLVLYMKEMDEERYQKLCAVSGEDRYEWHGTQPTTMSPQNYFSAVSDLHSKEVAGYLSTLTTKLKKSNDDDKYDGCKLDHFTLCVRFLLNALPLLQLSPLWQQLRQTRAGPLHDQRR